MTFDPRCVLREKERKRKKERFERAVRAKGYEEREWENWLRVVNVLVPLTGGHSVFYLNYSIIYIKVTGIFLRFIIRDNNSVPPLSHSCIILFLFTLVLRIPRTYNSPFSSARSLPSTLVSSSSHRFIHFSSPVSFLPLLSRYIYIIYNIYTHFHR